MVSTRVIRGDALEVLPHVVALESQSVLVSDPPFNIGYQYRTYRDKMRDADYYQMLVNVFGKGPHVMVHYPENLFAYAIALGQAPTKVVSWVYNSNTPRQHRSIAFFGVKPDFTKVGQPYKNPTDKRIAARIAEGKQARLYDWWNINQVKNTSPDKTNHPCQMPVDVMCNVVGLLPESVTIIDPFMGSGTTGVAAVKLGRSFVGIEMDAHYYEIAKQRIESAARQNEN